LNKNLHRKLSWLYYEGSVVASWLCKQRLNLLKNPRQWQRNAFQPTLAFLHVHVLITTVQQSLHHLLRKHQVPEDIHHLPPMV